MQTIVSGNTFSYPKYHNSMKMTSLSHIRNSWKLLGTKLSYHGQLWTIALNVFYSPSFCVPPKTMIFFKARLADLCNEQQGWNSFPIWIASNTSPLTHNIFKSTPLKNIDSTLDRWCTRLHERSLFFSWSSSKKKFRRLKCKKNFTFLTFDFRVF